MASRDPNLYVGNSDTAIPDSNDEIANWDDELRQAKSQANNSFPNVTGPVTANHEELNSLVGFVGLVPSSDEVLAAQEAANAAQTDIDAYPEASDVAITNLPNSFNGDQSVTGDVTVTGDIDVGNGGGDARINFFDEGGGTYRTLRWDTSASEWRVEDDGGTNRTVMHGGNLMQEIANRADEDEIGSYCIARNTSGTDKTFGQTISGSSLTPSSVGGQLASGSLSGTWRCLGHAPSGGSEGSTTLWLRIS